MKIALLVRCLHSQPNTKCKGAKIKTAKRFEEFAQRTVIPTLNPVIYNRLVVIELGHWAHILIFPLEIGL